MSEQRLIDADALGKKINEMPFYVNKDRENVLWEILSAPAVEAEPVRHGKWILHHIGVGHYWECSECHENPCIYVTEKTNYCPNCGARMDGDDT